MFVAASVTVLVLVVYMLFAKDVGRKELHITRRNDDMYTKKTYYALGVIWLLLGIMLGACAASQDASKAYSRGLIERGAIVPAENVRVHEYLNYYDQRFPVPAGEPLGLDLRLGNTGFPTTGGEIWLQVGLQAREAGRLVRTPLNLALVLDTSGSMGEPGKISYLRQSLIVFLETLEADDIVSIVTYDTSARVIHPASFVGDKHWIEEAVMQIQPGGQTNLHAGMMLGFEQVDQQFDVRRNNRVLLLTDGIANVGITNPVRIAENALEFNEKGIHLSTIGLGIDMNDELLSELAQQGHGAYHFVDSAQEMEKVFLEEVEGLVERVANDVQILIEPAPGFSLREVTGYEGIPPAEGVKVPMQDMGAGDSQVLLARLDGVSAAPGPREVAAVTLIYEDPFAQRIREVGGDVTVVVARISNYDPVDDVELRRNVTIVETAEALKRIDALYLQGEYLSAWQIARTMELKLREVALETGDQQMVEDADLFGRYQLTLESALGFDPESESLQPTPVDEFEGQPQRWGTEQLPTITIE
jgi:Ca-activated chloride channel family protein